MSPILKFIHWFSTPKSAPEIKKTNFINVQIDAIGVGLASAAAPFLPVYITRLGATPIEVGLLTAMPAITGLLFAIPLGRFLQKKADIVPWFSAARFLNIMSYAITGIITFLVPRENLVQAILITWAAVTIPQTILSITFSVVMNAVAGPNGRYELMTRRWSLLGITTSITAFLIGQVLVWVEFPLNYQLVFITLSTGGLISYYFSSHLEITESRIQNVKQKQSFFQAARSYIQLIQNQKSFVSFVSKRFIYLTGVSLAAPLFPLYYVRSIHAPDNWIAIISTAQTAVMVFGYFFWTAQSRKRGSRFVLLCTTLGLSLYPILTAVTSETSLITVYAGFAGIFQAGLDLVFFDELMKTVPPELCATFVAFAQSIQYISTIISPMIGSALADYVGISMALIISGGIRLLGFISFFASQKG